MGIIEVAGPCRLKFGIGSVEEYLWFHESERVEVPVMGRESITKCGLNLSQSSGGLYNKLGERIITRIVLAAEHSAVFCASISPLLFSFRELCCEWYIEVLV